MEIRNLELKDIDQILSIQKEAYQDHLIEDKNAFLDKIVKYHDFCIGVFFEGCLLAYLCSVPCDDLSLPTFNDPSIKVCDNPTFLYIHDLAVSKKARGKNLSQILLDDLSVKAQQNNLSLLKLISVQNTSSFWEKHDFVRLVQFNPIVSQKLLSFGDDAVMMVKTI